VSGTTVFATAEVPETSGSSYPAPFRAGTEKRHARRLGAHAGLANFGVNLVRLEPGGISSQRHWHTRQDEFVLVMEGELTLETDAGARVVGPGTCIGFPADSGDGHRLVNRTSRDGVFLVVGDRGPGDACHYPDVDLHLPPVEGGRRGFTRKDGTAW
jgi:uncharacterized cupin superfamily protein